VLSHPWHRASKTTPLPETVKALKKFNAARKLKRAALGVVAQEKLARSASESGFTPAAEPAPSWISGVVRGTVVQVP
jgi:hypothetical protein